MARIARVVVPGYPQHVTQRGNRRQQTFFCNDDYQAYVDLIAAAKDLAGVSILACYLMPNHVHLVAVSNTSDRLLVVATSPMQTTSMNSSPVPKIS